MTETEYDIIDELYFVTPYQQISQALGLTDAALGQGLRDLVTQGYVKCFYPDPDTEVEFTPARFAQDHQRYYFLATKAGLMAHNSR